MSPGVRTGREGVVSFHVIVIVIVIVVVVVLLESRGERWRREMERDCVRVWRKFRSPIAWIG